MRGLYGERITFARGAHVCQKGSLRPETIASGEERLLKNSDFWRGRYQEEALEKSTGWRGGSVCALVGKRGTRLKVVPRHGENLLY